MIFLSCYLCPLTSKNDEARSDISWFDNQLRRFVPTMISVLTASHNDLALFFSRRQIPQIPFHEKGRVSRATFEMNASFSLAPFASQRLFQSLPQSEGAREGERLRETKKKEKGVRRNMNVFYFLSFNSTTSRSFLKAVIVVVGVGVSLVGVVVVKMAKKRSASPRQRFVCKR